MTKLDGKYVRHHSRQATGDYNRIVEKMRGGKCLNQKSLQNFTIV